MTAKPHNEEKKEMSSFARVFLSGLAVIVLHTASCSTYGQILIKLDSLKKEVETINKQELEANISEYKTSRKYNWLYFVPDVGYDVLNNTPALRFSISGTSSLSSLISKQKKARQIIISLKKKAELNLKTQLVKLTNNYNLLNYEVENLRFKIKILDDYQKIFEIKKKQHHNHELTTEQFLIEKIKYLSRVEALRNYYIKIEKLKNEIQLIINRQLLVHLPQHE